ncbi:MAG TPA: UDP-N-acetylmuramate dehydrogenase [Desulfobacterales bacterium]|nr:UDP-N-acetylmuramate dehydrogenase [Desulfobacterales bacterium]
MRIGGLARYYAELESKEDVEEAYKFAKDKNIPLIVFGAGSNTIFADGTINALVVRIKASNVSIDNNQVIAESGKNLAQLVNELADQGLDLSTLTGIPGTFGGAVIGNAGQGSGGTWIDSYIELVTVFDAGEWKEMSKDECKFSYRESIFKTNKVIVWSVRFKLPKSEPHLIKKQIDYLLQKRISDQPHVKTSGSCFKAADDGTPAWQLIEKAELRGFKVGGIHVSDKHCNFLINDEDGNFEDVVKIINTIKESAPDVGAVEMRLIGEDGKLIQK